MHFNAIPTAAVHAFRAGAHDALNNPPERALSDGKGQPCRHCLRQVPAGAEMLVLAYKPFETTQAYSEVGPIFLCADDCKAGDSNTLPPILQMSPEYLLKGYTSDERIVYGTGRITPQDEVTREIEKIFDQDGVEFVHIRSARNNCYLARVDRTT